MNTIPMSSVNMDITAEEFITSETAKLSFTATFAITDSSFDPKTEVLTAAMQIANGDWYVTNVVRKEDNSGIETVAYNLAVRITEREVSTVKSNLKSVNRSGLKFVLNTIDYSPTQAQIEDGMRTLRRKIYQKANEELLVLNELVRKDEDEWLIGTIDFTNNNAPVSKSNMLRASASMMYENVGVGGEEADGVTQKLTLSSTVTFTRKIYSRL